MRQRSLTVLLVLSVPLAFSVSCGFNAFEAAESSDPAEDAVLALEDKDESRAIKILESALDEEPGHPVYLSLLAASYAQRAGVEPLAMAQRISGGDSSEEDSGSSSSSGSTGGSSGSSSNGSLVSMFGIMPRATESNLTDIDRAVAILGGELSREDWQPGDSFKMAIYQTASMVLHLKVLDRDEDGQLAVEEIASLSSGTSLLSQLASATALLGSDQNDQTMAKASEALAKHQTAIDAMPGTTTDDKLKNYLAKSSGLPTGSEVGTGTATSTATFR